MMNNQHSVILFWKLIILGLWKNAILILSGLLAIRIDFYMHDLKECQKLRLPLLTTEESRQRSTTSVAVLSQFLTATFHLCF